MISLKKVYTLLFFIGLFFFPFNNFEGLTFLGEYKNEAGAFFFIGGFFLMLFEGNVSLPFKSGIFRLLLVFYIWCIITTLLNINNISGYYFKHTSGISRFFRQFISFSFAVVIFFTFFWNVLKSMSIHELLLKIRSVFLGSLLFGSFFSFFEILSVIFHVPYLAWIMKLFDYLPFMGVAFHNERISSFSYEPPSLGIYLITVAGWMFSYIVTEKSIYRFVPTILILILTYFSGSRTALVTIAIQLFIFLFIIFNSPQYKVLLLRILGTTGILLMVLMVFNGNRVISSFEKKFDSLNFKENLTKSISNQSRFGIQYASLCVFAENPVIGVGFGQQSFEARHHYPGWATKNNWEFIMGYNNPAVKSFPPGYNIYTRLLAETGIIGIVIFLSLIFFSIKLCIRMLKKYSGEEKILAIILLTSFVGVALNWLQIDSFRIYAFWLCLVLLIRLFNENRLKNVTTHYE